MNLFDLIITTCRYSNNDGQISHQIIMNLKYSNAEILVVGTARNCASLIRNDINTLQTALVDFKRTHFFIVDSDSSDETLEMLELLKDTVPFFNYVSLGRIIEQYPIRTERLAVCRNRYLDELTSNTAYRDVNYVAVADLDGVNTQLSRDDIKGCWSVKEKWDVITANQSGGYYDIWALRHRDWSPVDYYYQKERLKQIMSEEQALNLALIAKRVFLKRDDPLIEVDSAFGGFAIYKREALLSGRYIGLDADGNEVCEHVPLHAGIRNKGLKIYINPALVNCHSPHLPDLVIPRIQPPLLVLLFKKIGKKLFGKKRFNKYLEFMKH